jgi:DNA-binding beta-propeller fold protein YncE
MRTHQFVPILSGISATDVTYSKDGKWVAYATYPDHTLWRSRSDGSERMQLTHPPIEVFEPFISPDGTKVVFDDMSDGSLSVVDMNAGPARKIVEHAASARWSPDGSSIVFSPANPYGIPFELRILEVAKGKISEVPSSRGKSSGFWLDQETLGAGAANGEDGGKLQIFDLRTQKWTDLVTMTDQIENQVNSPDGKYVYFFVRGAEPTVQRVRVADHHVEVIASLKEFSRVLNFGWPQLRVAPDGSPTLTRDVDLGQIYALNVKLP